MKSYYMETVTGPILFDGNGNVLKFKSFFGEPDILGNIFIKISKQETSENLNGFLNELNKVNTDLIVVENKNLVEILGKIVEKPIKYSYNNPKFKKFREELFFKLEELIPNFSEDELKKKSKFIAEQYTKENVKESGEQLDLHIKHLIETFEDTIKFINIFSVKLREWYGIHFPELTDNLISDNKFYAMIVKSLGSRYNISKDSLIKILHVREEYAEEIGKRSIDSMGGDFTPFQLENVRKLSEEILNLHEFRDHIEKSLTKILEPYTPNLLHIIGNQLTAKLITHAGSLKQLALLPSSTIQVLGAEKALFRSLKSRGYKGDASDSPKHGIIFTYPEIRGAKYWQRGKISRLLAGKIAIAAKVDYFKGDFVGDKLLEEINLKIKEIKEAFPKPPKKQKRKSKKFKSQRGVDLKKKKQMARNKRKQLSKSKYKKSAKRSRRH